jgi:phosphoribosylamine--glycine ligase
MPTTLKALPLCPGQQPGTRGGGPEQPLAEGITDYLQAQGLKVFGPCQAGAQIEASKAWAKALMVEAGIPTARAEVFSDEAAALAYLKQEGAPIVIKADGLAAGKGVTVAQTLEKAIQAITDIFSGRFGAAGRQVVIEECLTGQEASVLAVTTGRPFAPWCPPKTTRPSARATPAPTPAGMGAYAPTPVVTPEIMERCKRRC